MLNHSSSTFKKIVGLMISTIFLLLGASGSSSQAQAFQSPLPTPQPLQRQEVTLRDTTGETDRWSQFTSEGFNLRYPSDWQARVLPDQIAGTRIVELTHSTPDSRVDVSIQVWETWLSPGEDWEQEPEIQFYRKQSGQANHVAESVLVDGQPGWMTQAQPPINSGSLVRAVFVARESRLYRFRLYVYQDKISIPHLRTFGLLMSTLQTRLAPNRPSTLMPLEPAPKALPAGPISLAAVIANYNRDAAYAYAAAWYNQQNNSDGCYLWSNGSVLDCVLNSGDYGVDGAHFVNRAVWSGGRPIPQLLPFYPLEARTVSALRLWLINDGWTAIAASQAQVGDVVIIGNQCWAGLVVGTGNPPVVAAHSSQWWGSAGSLQCNGNFSKEYLHAPQGGFYSYLPLIVKNYPAVKTKSGIHLGNRSTDWTPTGGAPLDFLQRLDNRGVWPKAVVVLSNQLYYLDRPSTGGLCSIAQARVRASELYNYLGQAIQMGTKVIIRIAPSPGNFTDYANPGSNHTLLSGTTPAGSDYCNEKFDKFRDVNDVAMEMNEIYKVNVNQKGWSPSSFFFEPANEPNKEWYADKGNVVPKQDNSAAWQAMDAYFSSLYDQAHSLNPQLQVLTPAMAQNLYAEARAFTTCEIREVIGGGSGYDWMQQTYTAKNDGYAWHNYWRQAKEFWQSNFCLDVNSTPTSDHIFQYFPQWLQSQITSSGRPAFIAEADLLSPCPNPTHNITNKNSQAEATQESIWRFISEEHGANYVIAWLLTIEFSDTSGCIDNDEIAWHEAYREGYERSWFPLWWLRNE